MRLIHEENRALNLAEEKVGGLFRRPVCEEEKLRREKEADGREFEQACRRFLRGGI